MKNRSLFFQKTLLNRSACVLAFVLLIITVHAQTKMKWKQYMLPGTAMLLSGALDGTIESISFHYEYGFKEHLPNANDQFWNPELSWRNKYKNRDPLQGAKFFGSTTAFVFTTDAYHALRFSKNAVNTFTIIYYFNATYAEEKTFKNKWGKILIDILVFSGIRSIGFYTTYSLLLK